MRWLGNDVWLSICGAASPLIGITWSGPHPNLDGMSSPGVVGDGRPGGGSRIVDPHELERVVAALEAHTGGDIAGEESLVDLAVLIDDALDH